jgi:hypothetical protein
VRRKAALVRSPDAPAPAAPPVFVDIPPPRNDPARPLDREIAALPNARAVWFADKEYGKIYLLTVGPERPPSGRWCWFTASAPNGVRDWYPVLAQRSTTRRVVLFDLPGFGRSGQANLKYAPSNTRRCCRA